MRTLDDYIRGEPTKREGAAAATSGSTGGCPHSRVMASHNGGWGGLGAVGRARQGATLIPRTRAPDLSQVLAKVGGRACPQLSTHYP